MRDVEVRQRARITLGICNKCSNRLTKEEWIMIMKSRGDKSEFAEARIGEGQ